MKKYQTWFYWKNHLLATQEERVLTSTAMPLIAVQDGIATVNAGEWARAFALDELLFMQTVLVDE